MQKKIFFISIIITLLFVASCSNSNSDKKAAGEYTVFGTVSQDSALQGTDLRLFIDKHDCLVEELLPVLKGKFIYKGLAEDFDELFIIDELGRSVSVFAGAGDNIEVNIDSLGQPSFGGTDSINSKLQRIAKDIVKLNLRAKKDYIDSVCVKYKNSIIPVLALRQEMQSLNDSVYIRQCLGGIDVAMKPKWALDAIEELFAKNELRLKKNNRLSPLPVWKTDVDSISINFVETRQNAMFLYFWADYSKSSIDSLQLIEPMAKYFGLENYLEEFVKKEKNRRPRRVDIVTVCLNATDSAAWKDAVKDIPGRHIYIKEGFANPVINNWKITRLPYNVVIDRFSNIQDSYRWGKELYDVIDKMPTNFSTQFNGSNNKNSRTSRN